MRSGHVWTAYAGFALCLVGAVAWPLWSENDGWAFAFVGLGIVVVAPIVLGPPLTAIWSALGSKQPDSE